MELTQYQMSVFTTLLLGVAIVQLALISLGRGWIGSYPMEVRRWLLLAHRFGGYIGFFIILLVTYSCVVYYGGFLLSPARVALHSIVGTVMLAIIMAKIVITRGLRQFYAYLPYFGVVLFATVIITWLNSAGWYFWTVGFE